MNIQPATMLDLMAACSGQTPTYRRILRGYGLDCYPGDYIEITLAGCKTVRGILLRIEDKPQHNLKTDTPIQLLVQEDPFQCATGSMGWMSMRLPKGAKVTRVVREFLQTQNSLVKP